MSLEDKKSPLFWALPLPDQSWHSSLTEMNGTYLVVPSSRSLGNVSEAKSKGHRKGASAYMCRGVKACQGEGGISAFYSLGRTLNKQMRLHLTSHRSTIVAWSVNSCLQCSSFFFFISISWIFVVSITPIWAHGEQSVPHGEHLVIIYPHSCHWNLESIQQRIPSCTALLRNSVFSQGVLLYSSHAPAYQLQRNSTCGQTDAYVFFLTGTVCAVAPTWS